MIKVRIIGHRNRLDAVLDALHDLQALHLIDVNDDAGIPLPPLHLDDVRLRELEELRYLKARVDAMLALVPNPPPSPEVPVHFESESLAALRRELDEDGPEIERLVRRLDELEAETEVLPRYLESLRKLLPLVPELTTLKGYETTALLVDGRHSDVLGELNQALEEALGANFEILSGQVDRETIGAVLVFPRTEAAVVRSLLGREQLTQVRLPHRFDSMPFAEAITAIERRLVDLPVEIAATQDAIDDLIRSRQSWAAASVALANRLDQLEAIRHLGATAHTFVISGWVPERRLDDVQTRLSGVGPDVSFEPAVPEPGDAPPVLMENPRPARPFEFLVRLLALPRYGEMDPTRLMTLFLPLFFGMMLGDVGYGTVLLALSIAVGRRFRFRSGVVRDLARVLQFAAAWAIAWGFVYGEFLGDLGHRWFGLQPLWINREEALEPLLVFAIAIGGAHILLGFILGIVESIRGKRRHQLYERLAMVTALSGLFLVAGVAADQIPAGALTPAVAAIVVGLVILMALGGAMGILMGPLELLGTIGNVLSYLRLAAIGLASVYLARVANELGATGPLWLGVIVASLFHALNLALGTFSPMIQALRLHYVEFFGKFFESGGEAYKPFGMRDGSGPAATT